MICLSGWLDGVDVCIATRACAHRAGADRGKGRCKPAEPGAAFRSFFVYRAEESPALIVEMNFKMLAPCILQYGRTALILASAYRHETAVQALIEAKADLNLQDKVIISISLLPAPCLLVGTRLPVIVLCTREVKM